MRFYILTLLFALFAISCLALTAQKAVIISYPDETPDSILDQAMNTIREAGGVITHEYKFIKGFAAKASEVALESVKTLGSEYLPIIEEDAIVSIDGDLINNGHTN